MKNLLTLICLGLAISVSATSGWKTNLPDALKEAKKTGKYVLVDFSGSDWCHYCIQLDKKVFNKPIFKKFAEKKLVLVLIDFPERKKQSAQLKAVNQALAVKYKVEGFPTVLLMASDGKVLLVTGYLPGGPKAYIKHLEKAMPKKAKAAAKK